MAGENVPMTNMRQNFVFNLWEEEEEKGGEVLRYIWHSSIYNPYRL